MARTKTNKASVVADIEKRIKDAGSIVFVEFNKLRVGDANALRRKLQGEDVGYIVAKKTLIRRALEPRGFTGNMPELPGEIALAYGTDAIGPARGIFEFASTHKDEVKIAGGVFGGGYMDAVKMMEIATIPSREVLLSQIAYLLKSPIQGLAIAVSEVAKTKN